MVQAITRPVPQVDQRPTIDCIARHARAQPVAHVPHARFNGVGGAARRRLSGERVDQVGVQRLCPKWWTGPRLLVTANGSAPKVDCSAEVDGKPFGLDNPRLGWGANGDNTRASTGVMGVFVLFLWHLWSNFWWFLTSGPLVIEPMLDYLFPHYEAWINQYISRAKRRQIAYGLSVLGIITASFLAFQDVYLKLERKRRN
jgi:hypothetical protein